MRVQTRLLRPSELTRGTEPQLPLVVEPAGPGTSLSAWLGENRDAVRAHLDRHGGVLFRGFDVGSAEAFEAAVRAQGVALSDSYFFGTNPRQNLRAHVFTSSEAPAWLPLPLHCEMSDLPVRPGAIAFYCHVAPAQYGETPIVDCRAIYRDVDPALRGKLERTAVKYVRKFRGRRSLTGYPKPWQEVFGVTDRARVEQRCAALGTTVTWHGDDALITETRVPSLVKHPRTGELCFNAQLYHLESMLATLQVIRERYHPLQLAGIRWLAGQVFGRNPVASTVLEDGTAFTPDEVQHVQDVTWRHVVVFTWQRGDVLLLDNLLASHGRLNVRGPRTILTAFGDLYDVRQQQTLPAA